MRKTAGVLLCCLLFVLSLCACSSEKGETLEQTALRITKEMQEQAADEAFLEWAAAESLFPIIEEFAAQNYDRPLVTVQYTFQDDFFGHDGEVSDALVYKMKNAAVTGSVLAQLESVYLSVASILNVCKAMAKPSGYASDCVLMLVYENACSFVSFVESEDGTIFCSSFFAPNSFQFTEMTSIVDFQELFPAGMMTATVMSRMN